ncbi:MAG: efflux RND transporter periplasmic adaptor subunit [Gammaproteobacteria bacterium]|jgi:RND family efflux transporter MFP subunit|nr:efflux RND transporter periplasmic adaptor subunit [Gammaproteobacteria bacterium]
MIRSATGSSGYSKFAYRAVIGKVVIGVATLTMLVPLLGWSAEYEAVLDWNRKSKLSTPVSGVVANVSVRPGDRVAQGDILLQLDNSVIKANLEKSKADVQHYERLYKEAERELERNKELYDRTVLSDHELELAHIAFTQATAQLKSAQAQMEKMAFDLRHSEITAPFNGIVVARNVNEGETIVSSETAPVLIEVAEADVMVAGFQVSGGQLGKFKMGEKATVAVGGNQYKGEVSAVGFEPVAKSGNRYLINVRFDTKSRLLRAGRSAKVIVP